MIATNFKKSTKERYFNGVFLKPAPGRISSVFAKVRVYNNGRTSSHAGVDIANKPGTIITAPAPGNVILSERLKVHGETVMIDHGFGVVSIMCHLQKRYVKVGEFLSASQHIGEMGMTGVASGVHLHWGLSVQNVRVDPLYWISKEVSFLN